MRIYIHKYMYICEYVHTHIFIYVHTHICINIHTYTGGRPTGWQPEPRNQGHQRVPAAAPVQRNVPQSWTGQPVVTVRRDGHAPGVARQQPQTQTKTHIHIHIHTHTHTHTRMHTQARAHTRTHNVPGTARQRQ